jgi:hypothetical protein
MGRLERLELAYCWDCEGFAWVEAVGYSNNVMEVLCELCIGSGIQAVPLSEFYDEND